MKNQKGVTFAALVITIVILLVLAIVSITVVKEGDIITGAQNAVERTKDVYYEENKFINQYSNYLNEIQQKYP